MAPILEEITKKSASDSEPVNLAHWPLQSDAQFRKQALAECRAAVGLNQGDHSLPNLELVNSVLDCVGREETLREGRRDDEQSALTKKIVAELPTAILDAMEHGQTSLVVLDTGRAHIGLRPQLSSAEQDLFLYLRDERLAPRWETLGDGITTAHADYLVIHFERSKQTPEMIARTPKPDLMARTAEKGPAGS